ITAFAGGGVTKSDLLKARMKITTYNQHRVDSFLPSLVVRTTKILARRESTLSCNQRVSGSPNRAGFARLGVVERWDNGNKKQECRRYGRLTSLRLVVVPSLTGLGFVIKTYPTLKRWAKLYRAYGAGLLGYALALLPYHIQA